MTLDIYPSRTVTEEKLIKRTCPLARTKNAFESQLSSEQVRFFAENGYLALDGILANKVDALLAEIDVIKKSVTGRDELILEPDTDIVRSIFSPDKFSSLYHEIACHPVLLNSAKQLLGSDVYIHHSRLNIKEGLNGKSFPWHSDFETWHSEDGIPIMRIITGWIFLTENNEYNGPLYVIPGSHKVFVSCVGETPKNNYQSSLRKQTYGVTSPR